MRKRIVLLFASVLLVLAGCGKKEIVTQPIPDPLQDYNYTQHTTIVLDAIIDNEAEKQYIQKIHQQYTQYVNYYHSYVAKSSGLTAASNAQTVASTQQGFQTLINNIEAFKQRINTINLPRDYGNAMNDALSGCIQSLQDEKARLGKDKETKTAPNSTFYETVQNAHQRAQKAYQQMMQS